jgi:hypothetical protein
MRKSDRTYILVSVFVSLTAFCYWCTVRFPIPLPRYYPLEHVWKWVNEKGVPSQGWYGMQAFAYLAAGVVTLAVCGVLSRPKTGDRPIRPAALKVFGVLATLIVVACLSLMLHEEFAKWGIFK